MSYFKNINIQASDSPSIDAFSRLRVSSPETIFDSKQIYDTQALFWDDQEVSGGSTATNHSANEAATTLSVGATTAGKRVRQTKMWFNYQPGKSQLILMTAAEFATSTGITKEIGLFNNDNGLFFRSAEGTVSVCRRSKITGSAVTTVVTQANWNLDTMDGNGVSGITLDFDKSQIYVIDFEWLGVGRVRMGVNVDGLIYYVHEFLNANNLAGVYMSTPNLPLRYSIENDGNGAADDLVHICSSVSSEGGVNQNGIVRYASTAGTAVATNAENSVFAVIGIRLKAAYLGATINILNVALQLQTASITAEWALYLNPTVAGTFSYSDQTNSAVQIATGATANTITNGTQLAGGFVESGGIQSGSAGSGSGGINSALHLGSTINGTVDTMVLGIRPIGGDSTADVEGSITWRELS